MKYFGGIDPGKNGSIAVIDENCKVHCLRKIPTIKVQKNEYDVSEIKSILKTVNESFNRLSFVVEKAHAMPKQGVVSMFSIGYGYGLLIGMLNILAVPVTEVHPRVWTKDILKGVGGTGKGRNYQVACRLFPEWETSYKYEHDWCDSLLLAYYNYKNWDNGCLPRGRNG